MVKKRPSQSGAILLGWCFRRICHPSQTFTKKCHSSVCCSFVARPAWWDGNGMVYMRAPALPKRWDDTGMPTPHKHSARKLLLQKNVAGGERPERRPQIVQAPCPKHPKVAMIVGWRGNPTIFTILVKPFTIPMRSRESPLHLRIHRFLFFVFRGVTLVFSSSHPSH